MSRMEHLIENAIMLQSVVFNKKKDSKVAWEQFSEDETNIKLAATCDLSLDTAWKIAFYVVDNWIYYHG